MLNLIEDEKLRNRIEEILTELNDTYIYLKISAKFYWVEKSVFFNISEIGTNIMATKKEIDALRKVGTIKDFNELCYLKGGKEGCYNMLDENKILKPSNTPELDQNIKKLIDNVCGYKKENIEYLHKITLYKYLNINDYTIPAIVFFGTGGSGKGSFINLLSTIFGEDNTLANLGQRELNSDYDTYTGNKLVVEYAELSTHNKSSDYKILNKLKNIIGAEKITVNQKGIKQYQINNIAWFFISSNSNKPLQLDDKDKGNRRFSIIRSISKLDNGSEIYKSITDKNIASNYLAWLIKEFPDIKNQESINALNNEDKRELEERTQHESNLFWDWFFEKYPNHESKVRVETINEMIGEYCDQHEISKKEFMKYFWDNSRYGRRKIRIGKHTYSGVDFSKN